MEDDQYKNLEVDEFPPYSISDKTGILEYAPTFKLDSGATLKTLFFNQIEHRWIFEYQFVKRKDTLRKVDFVNNLSLVVDYNKGISQNCNLFMNMVNLKNLGKKYKWGMDLSPNSKVSLKYIYEKNDESYDLVRIESNRHDAWDKREPKEGLVKQIDFPFPIEDLIKNYGGTYKVPFLNNDGRIQHFEFPENYRQNI